MLSKGMLSDLLYKRLDPAIHSETVGNSRISHAAASLIFLLSLLLLPAVATAAQISGEMRQWYPLTVDFEGPRHNELDNTPNPFLDYRLTVFLTSPTGLQRRIPGFFAGDGAGGSEGNVWRARFSPDEAGEWAYTAEFLVGGRIAIDTSNSTGNTAAFDGETGTFVIAERDDQAPGFLRHGALEYVGKHYLKFRDGPYWIKSGTNSPENLLAYEGFEGTVDHGGVELDFLHRYEPHIDDAVVLEDPFFENPVSGVGSQGITGAINYLSSVGVNSVYFLPLNLGGDGQDTYPFVSAENTAFAKTHFDIGKLYQWAQLFDHAQRRGVALHVVLAETELANERWLDDGDFGLERRLFFRELIARFGFALGLKWNLSEENDFSTTQLREMALYISQLDWSKKPVSVHTHLESFSHYTELLGDQLFSATSFQYGVDRAGQLVEEWRRLSREAGHPWVLDMDENTTGLSSDNAELLRKRALYDVYFSGGNIEWYFGFNALPLGGDVNVEDFRTRAAMWDFMRYARRFMQDHLPFWEMQPQDSLVTDESQAFGGAEVFAKPGEVYAIYLPASDGNAKIDLSAAQSMLFDKRWFNPASGQFEGDLERIEAAAVTALGTPPSRQGDDWVVLLTRRQDVSLAGNSVTASSDQIENVNVDANLPETALVAEPQQVLQPVSPDSGSRANQLPVLVDIPQNLTVTVGTNIELRMLASDADGTVPALFLVNAPLASTLTDNFDGSRTFRWVPSEADAGQHEVMVVAADAADLDQRTNQQLIINVEALRVNPESGFSNSPGNPATDPATTNEVLDVSGNPLPITLPLRAPLEANLAPVLFSPEQMQAPVGAAINLIFVPLDPEGIVPHLWIEKLPPGAAFNDNGNGSRSLVWTPGPEDRGEFPLQFVVADSRDPSLRSRHQFSLKIVDQTIANSPFFESNITEVNDRPDNKAAVFPALAAPDITVGRTLELDVTPVDPEGQVPILHVQNAPDNASFEDNGRGGRLFRWTPGSDQLGDRFVKFIAIDAVDPSISSEIVRRIRVTN